jgi:2-keto-4-pentenoate hydratase
MTDPVAQAAELLLAARRDPTKKLADLPATLRPADHAVAYAIQQKVAATFPAIGGWKVSPFGDGTPPVCGALPGDGVIRGPARLTSNALSTRGIEAELCVRIGRDLPARGTPYSRADVSAAIASLHPAIEVLDSRFIDYTTLDPLVVLADTQSHIGLVYGPGVAAWQGVDLASESVEQFVDGVLDASHTGHPAKDLVGQVVWLANVGSAWAGGLRAGQFVTCGSWTGAHRVGPAARVRVKFSTVGEVALQYVG